MNALTPLPTCAHTSPSPPNIATPSPCIVGSLQQQGWSGPCYYRICSDTVQGLGGIQQPKCCYWVVYYQRMMPDPFQSGYERYETNVTGIFYDGDDCERRSRGQIIHAFQNALYRKLNYDNPTFFDNHYMPSGSGEASHNFYSTGGCFQKDANGDIVYDDFGNPVNCDEDIYCCMYTKQIHYMTDFLGIRRITKIDSLNSQNPNPVYEVTKFGTSILCSSTCKKACDNVLMEPAAMALCEAPCNNGMWTPKVEYLFLPFCPGCTVKVYYKTREINNCPEYGMQSVNDIYLDKIEWDNMELGTPCAMCPADLNAVHSYVIDYLVKNKFPKLPDLWQCDHYYRLFQAACWFDHYQEPYEAWPAKRYLTMCGEENCCFHRYRLCNYGTDNIQYTLLETQNNSVDCHIYIYIHTRAFMFVNLTLNFNIDMEV